MTTTKFNAIRKQEMTTAAKVFAAVLKDTPVQGDGTTTWPMRVMRAYAAGCAEHGITITLDALYEHYRGRELSAAAKHFFKERDNDVQPPQQPQIAAEIKGANKPPVSLVPDILTNEEGDSAMITETLQKLGKEASSRERSYKKNGLEVKVIYDHLWENATYRPMYPWSRVECVQVPEPDSEGEENFFENLKEFIAAEDVGWVRASTDHVTVCRHEGGWLAAVKEKGATIKNKGKVVKRVKVLDRLFRIHGDVDNLKVEVGSDEKPQGWTDGLFYMRTWVRDQLLDAAGIGEDHKFRKVELWNARVMITLPEHGPVQIKGNVLFTDHLPGDGDLWTHPDNMKTECGGNEEGKALIGLEPMPAKDRVRTSIMSMVTMPPLFQDVAQWAKEELERQEENLKNGKIEEDMEDLFDSVEQEWANHTTNGDFTSKLYLRRWQVPLFYHTVKSKGYDPFKVSTYAMTELFDARARSMRSDLPPNNFYDHWRMDITVRCPKASYVQIVSATAARLGGYDVDEVGGVKDNELRRPKGWPFAVVSDRKWAEASLTNHGGPDFDDKFCLYYRMWNGKKTVFVMRFPCDRGEWDALSFHEGDHEPAAKDWPAVTFDRKQWPRMSDFKKGEIEIGETSEKLDVRNSVYDKDQAVKDLERFLAGGNPGGVINRRMVWASAHPDGGVLRYQRLSIEDTIDTCTQGGAMQDVIEVKEWAHGLLYELLRYRQAVDTLMWRARGSKKKLFANMRTRDTWLTNTYREVHRLVEEACKRVYEYAYARKDHSFLRDEVTRQGFESFSAANKFVSENSDRSPKWWQWFDARKLAPSLKARGLGMAAAMAVNKEVLLWNAQTFKEYLVILRDQLPEKLDYNDAAGTLNDVRIVECDYHKESGVLLVILEDETLKKYVVAKQNEQRQAALRNLYKKHRVVHSKV